MPTETRIVATGTQQGTVKTAEGSLLTVPADWELLPPGDATLTRRVKSAGPSWTVQEKKGRRTFSQGVYAPQETIRTIRLDLEEERKTPAYAKRRQADAARRDKKQGEYVGSFRDAVLAFLKFAEMHQPLAGQLADKVTEHATPIGSGTVARTERIPIERRAESAVIAWMRHQTTAYDHMKIARVKGKRREVRRLLATESRRLLDKYRRGENVSVDQCPLQQALRDTPDPS